MEKIIKVLKETKGVSAYKIIDSNKKSCELFYVLDKLETNRATNINEKFVTIYVKKGKMVGSSEFTVYNYMDEEDIKEEVKKALQGAKLALNPKYKLPKPVKTPVVSPKSNMGDKPFNEVIKDIVDAVFKANKYAQGWLNSVEFFLTRKDIHFVNSNGIDVKYTKYVGEIEVIPTWKKGKEEFELYNMITFSNIDLNLITKQVKEILLQAKARANASVLENKNDIKVIISGDDNNKLLLKDYFVSDLSCSAKFNHVNLNEVGKSIQGEDIKGDKLTIDLVPDLLNSPVSSPIDDDGIVLKKIHLVKDGIALRNFGGNQFSQYLGVKPTGSIPNIVVKGGTTSIKEMKSEPYLECVKFSALQVDRMSGFFGGEVRLGYYFDGTKVIPVTGFAISGSLHDLKGSMVLSKEVETIDGYKGPKAIAFKGIKIN